MPVRLCALTDQDVPSIFAWILSEPLQTADDGFSAQIDGKTYAVASKPFHDVNTGDEIGKFVFTVFNNLEKQQIEVLDVDIVLKNGTPSHLLFERKLPQSSDSNEYYEVVTDKEEQHLIVETVNRYTVSGELEGTKRDVFVSAFPFELTVFQSEEEYNRFFGFDEPIYPGKLDMPIYGLSKTFACPFGVLTHQSDAQEQPWSFLAGEIRSLREIRLGFGEKRYDAYLVILHSALGDIPTLVGKQQFDVRKIGVSKIIGMNAYVKANFVQDKYPKK